MRRRLHQGLASGTLAHRPALTEAWGYLRPGDTLVVTKLDRLCRSVKNLEDVAEQLDAAEVGLRAISQGIDITTPGGRLFSTCWPPSPNSSTSSAWSAPARAWRPPGIGADVVVAW